MDAESKRRLGWSDRCCLCGQPGDAYNNPDPLRDGEDNCCNACNRLVMAARRKLAFMPEEERRAQSQRFRALPYESLREELGPQ